MSEICILIIFDIACLINITFFNLKKKISLEGNEKEVRQAGNR